MTAVFFKPELDVRVIARWYDNEDPGLGDQFTDHLKVTLARISALPNQFPKVAGGVLPPGVSESRTSALANCALDRPLSPGLTTGCRWTKL